MTLIIIHIIYNLQSAMCTESRRLRRIHTRTSTSEKRLVEKGGWSGFTRGYIRHIDSSSDEDDG